ncbi:hypothetical protein M153_9000013386 [Pseudoloma neurophilia]|uniref:Uncharacterized protein n=1 Tax=Pseudoloma neurophilia TaxID=146866 RepID=A0A0R0M6B7_9MICR|nr:hypothetical protein M153_9000013386 [Pseudoloma neurophilia]
MKPTFAESCFLATKVGVAGRANRSIIERYLQNNTLPSETDKVFRNFTRIKISFYERFNILRSLSKKRILHKTEEG